MLYKVVFRPSAARQLHRLSSDVQERLTKAIDALSAEPRPVGVAKIEGADLWRIRVGEYRVVYQVDDAGRLVRIVRIGHRREVYRSL